MDNFRAASFSMIPLDRIGRVIPHTTIFKYRVKSIHPQLVDMGRSLDRLQTRKNKQNKNTYYEHTRNQRRLEYRQR